MFSHSRALRSRHSVLTKAASSQLIAVLRAASSLLTPQHLVSPHSFGSRDLRLPKVGMRNAFP